MPWAQVAEKARIYKPLVRVGEPFYCEVALALELTCLDVQDLWSNWVEDLAVEVEVWEA